MARTHRNLFPRIADFAALHAAYLRARRGKRARAEVLLFEADLEGELLRLEAELRAGTYRTGRYTVFWVAEPKRRMVAALPFRDRVVQHALVAVLEPIWEREFFAHSYACRPGRGAHAGVAVVERWIRAVKRAEGAVCALKLDVAGYFASIDHAVMDGLLRRRIACPRTLALCADILASWSAGAPGKGLPIGNLTSQLWANVYLHELDRYAKQELRARHYARYMDDVVIVGHDLAQLHVQRRAIEAFLVERLALRTNRKTQVFRIGARGRALDWLGYRIRPTHRRIRRDSVRRMRRRLEELRRDYARGALALVQVTACIRSWVAHAAHAQTWRLRSRLLGAFRLEGYNRD